jgi:hypothetical protein
MEEEHQRVGDNAVSNNETTTTTIESSPSSKPKSKGTKKKKKKKVSRNSNDSNSSEFLSGLNEQSDDKSSNGMETTTVVSTASSKLKSKGTKKKKKNINANDDGENLDTVSVSSNKSKSSQKKKKKKKKISREGESVDDVPDSARSLLTSSIKSTSKSKSKSGKSLKSPKSTKSKKKKEVKSSNENKPTTPDIERTKSLDLDGSTFVDLKRADRPSDFIVKRSMSLDECNSHSRPQPSMSNGRMNSQREHRENGMNGNNGNGRGSAQHGGRGRGPPVMGRGRGRGPGILAASRPQRPSGARGVSQEGIPYRVSSHERTPYGARSVSQEGIPYRGSSHERTPYGSRSVSQERPPYGARGSSHERLPYGTRGVSEERLPYGNTKVTNGRGSAPSPRGQRGLSSPPPTTFDKNPSSQSVSSKGKVYRAPRRPKPILRNSSHHRNDRSVGTSPSQSSRKRRVSIDLNSGSTHSYKYDSHASFASEIDSSDVESDDASSFAMEDNHRSDDMEDSGKRHRKQVPSTVTKGFSRTLSGLGPNSSHHISNFKASSHSTRSLMTIERSEFPDENRFIQALRYIHILAPHPNEDPIKKKIRIITWIALFLDFLNALGERNTKSKRYCFFFTFQSMEFILVLI